MAYKQLNVRTNTHVTVGDTYEVPSINSTLNLFGVLCQSEDMWLSLGHETPSDATSIFIPTGTAFELDVGVLGPVFVRTATTTHAINMWGA